MQAQEYQDFVSAGLDHRQTKTARPMTLEAFGFECAGELGEFYNAVKHEVIWPDTAEGSRTKTLDEAGDVLWYLTAMLCISGVSLHDVMTHNIKKLKERYGY